MSLFVYFYELFIKLSFNLLCIWLCCCLRFYLLSWSLTTNLVATLDYLPETSHCTLRQMFAAQFLAVSRCWCSPHHTPVEDDPWPTRTNLANMSRIKNSNKCCHSLCHTVPHASWHTLWRTLPRISEDLSCQARISCSSRQSGDIKGTSLISSSVKWCPDLRAIVYCYLIPGHLCQLFDSKGAAVSRGWTRLYNYACTRKHAIDFFCPRATTSDPRLVPPTPGPTVHSTNVPYQSWA